MQSRAADQEHVLGALAAMMHFAPLQVAASR